MAEPAGANLGMTLWATDVYALADFLVAVAGAEAVQRHPGYAELEIGGARLEVHDDESYRGHPWYQALAREGVARGIGVELRISVPDVQAAYGEALKRGAQSIAAPYDHEGRRECQVMGPDGYVLCLWQVWESLTSA